ncbi:hypothetical protein GOEFS_009_00530 [Gordonia effusa NBRC 100432]|uniref:Uncharacterized protein n=1 Tax=Gordonia effusa NBRC 100432 TaxID=1077974 RepID=H0QV33_9ACTN|nr:hypothetical protein GOEFS_009_00530 [Gordonia effusa NBRC 100432]
MAELDEVEAESPDDEQPVTTSTEATTTPGITRINSCLGERCDLSRLDEPWRSVEGGVIER